MNDNPQDELEKLARQEARPSLVGDFLRFLLHNKKWWLLPLLAIFLLMGVLMYLSTTAAAPFIYTLF